MNFISINTCTNICSVALFDNEKVQLKEKDNIKDHSEYIAIFTKELIEKSSKKIDFIAIAIGPGSYAGLKAGLSFAKGLSLALNIPILPIETFLAMNENINYHDKYYLGLFSHRRYVYIQEYKNNKPMESPKCIKYDELKDFKIYKVNRIFRAVNVNKPTNKVIFVYDPLSYKIGKILSLIISPLMLNEAAHLIIEPMFLGSVTSSKQAKVIFFFSFI